MEIHFQATSDIYKSYMYVNVDRHAKHKTQTKKEMTKCKRGTFKVVDSICMFQTPFGYSMLGPSVPFWPG